MKTIKFMDQTLEAERIVKTTDSIIGYTGDSEVFAFRGVSDFSLFQIDGEYDTPEANEPDIDAVAAELVNQELTSLDLKQQNEVMGAELVKKDLAIFDLQKQNQVLGSMLTALELKITANQGGTTNV